MARKPKTQPSPEIATAAPVPEFAAPDEAPAPTRRGRKPKAAAPSPALLPAAGISDPSAAGPEQALVEGDARAAELAFPLDDTGAGDAAHGGIHLDEAVPDDVLSSTAPAAAARAVPAARWDRATDAVEFDWPEIERVASAEGPNQVMAKLLVAARAEGARSRWPF